MLLLQVVSLVLSQFRVRHRSSLENHMSEQIYLVRGLANKFPSLVQVQVRWDRADSQMGRSREQAAVLE